MNSPRRQASFLLTLLFTACASGAFDDCLQAQGVDQDSTIRVYRKVAPATVFIKSALTSDYLMNG